ncbi:unnamed protein product [Closterium sp. Yama58-4]|nr:unnamed protein product [Closterium sp. Yama58-4]
MFAKFRQQQQQQIQGGGDSSPWMESEEPEPTELNPSKCGQRLLLSKDKLSVTYTGNGTHNNDVGAIQANRAAPSQRAIYYFEIVVKDRGARGCVAVGFADASFKTCRQPGWEASSYGYHGDNGKVYHNSGRGEAYGPEFTTNDVVGAGINYGTHEIFFTKNGKSLGPAFRDVKGELFPTIGLHSPNERHARLPSSSQTGGHAMLTQVDRGGGPGRWTGEVDRGGGLGRWTGEVDREVDWGGGLGRWTGEVDWGGGLGSWFTLYYPPTSSFSHPTSFSPHAISPKPQNDSAGVTFLLRTTKFAEIVRSGSLEAALAYARSELSGFRGRSPDQDALLEDFLALLAYPDATASPLAYLLHPSHRDAVADQERGWTGADVIRGFAALAGAQGELFCLKRMLGGGKEGCGE